MGRYSILCCGRVYGRVSAAPGVSLALGRRLLFFLTPMRERSAGLGATSWSGTFGGAACRVTGRRALRRSTVAIFDEATGLLSSDRGIFTTHVIQPAFALPFIRRCPSHLRQPPLGRGRCPRFLGRGYKSRLQAPHPALPTKC